MTTESISILSLIMSVLSLIVGIAALVIVLALKLSTHKIEWRTISGPNSDGHIPELEDDEEEEPVQYDRFGRPIDKQLEEFNKLYPDIDKEFV